MKKILTIMTVLVFVLTLSGCTENKYKGDIEFFRPNEIDSYTMVISYFEDVEIKYQDQHLSTKIGDEIFYSYQSDNDFIELFQLENGSYIGIPTGEDGDLYSLHGVFVEMNQAKAFSEYKQDGKTNRFYYNDANSTFEIWLNEENYVIEFKVSDSEGDVLLHMYDVNNTVIELPTHEVKEAYDYVLSEIYEEFLGVFAEDGDYIQFDDGLFTIKLKKDGSELLYIDELGAIWEYQLNGVIGFRNEADIYYSLTEFRNLYPDFDEDYLDQLLSATEDIKNPSVLFE